MVVSALVAVILLHLAIFSTAQECTEGDMEFVGLSVSHAGIVRVCHNGVWGTICADQSTPWNEKNCQVACRSAGYLGPVSPILQSTINAMVREEVKNDPIHYSSVQCDGSEISITQCLSSENTTACIHNYDAAVSCTDGRGPGSSQSEALSGKAIPGPVIASVLAVGIIGGLIFLACRMNAPVPATTTSQPPPPAPAPPPPQPTTSTATESETQRIASIPTITISEQQDIPSGPAEDLTYAAPPTYQDAVAYPTIMPRSLPTYTDKTGPYRNSSTAYPSSAPSARAGPSSMDYPAYPSQPYNQAFPPHDTPAAQPDFPPS